MTGLSAALACKFIQSSYSLSSLELAVGGDQLNVILLLNMQWTFSQSNKANYFAHMKVAEKIGKGRSLSLRGFKSGKGKALSCGKGGEKGKKTRV